MPADENVRTDNWRSIFPQIRVENAHYRYALTDEHTLLMVGEQREIDMAAILEDAQTNWKRCLEYYDQPMPDAD